jgi:hypothetical protein
MSSLLLQLSKYPIVRVAVRVYADTRTALRLAVRIERNKVAVNRGPGKGSLARHKDCRSRTGCEGGHISGEPANLKRWDIIC